MVKSNTSKDNEKINIIIKLSTLFFIASAFSFLSLTFYMLMQYNSDKALPLIISSGYFTITLSTLSLFMSMFIYSRQEEPKIKKEKLVSLTTLITILISLFFILKDTLFLDEIPLCFKLAIIITLLIFFLFTIGIRFLKITCKHIEDFNNGCCERFKEFFHYNRKRYY